MRLASFDRRLEPQLRALARSLGRLDQDQGKAARRNARNALRAAQRALDAGVDELYPAPPRKKTRRRGRRTARQKFEALRAKGWKIIPHTRIDVLLAAAGIRIRRVGDGSFTSVLAPAWAVTVAARRPKKLRAARKSIRRRKALLAEIALEREGERNAAT